METQRWITNKHGNNRKIQKLQQKGIHEKALTSFLTHFNHCDLTLNNSKRNWLWLVVAAWDRLRKYNNKKRKQERMGDIRNYFPIRTKKQNTWQRQTSIRKQIMFTRNKSTKNEPTTIQTLTGRSTINLPTHQRLYWPKLRKSAIK